MVASRGAMSVIQLLEMVVLIAQVSECTNYMLFGLSSSTSRPPSRPNKCLTPPCLY